MSNGRHAIKGFEYQATVNLDLILKYFQESTEQVLICPEGEDDLVVFPISGNIKHFYQIKKPKEFENGELKNESWTLSEVVHNLLPGTIDRLKENQNKQTWILGDNINSDVKDFIIAGNKASPDLSDQYLIAIHLLARDISDIIPKDSSPRRQELLNWYPLSGQTIESTLNIFYNLAISKGIKLEYCDLYKNAVIEIHSVLPDVLKRTTITTMYGTDDEIRNRIHEKLNKYYHLEREIITNTLIPGLRNYIYNVSSQKGITISKTDFENEIRMIWPRMTLVCNPPIVDNKTLHRTSLIEKIIHDSNQGSVEITGISGSGKTTLASELINHIKVNTDIHTFYIELKSEHSFRDALAGIAFHLRNFGIDNFFSLVIRYFSSDERVLSEMTELINISTTNIIIIIDLVNGTCSEDFANNLAKFLEKLNNNLFRFIVLGQESSFRMLTHLQRIALNLPSTIDIPGFNFEEFFYLYKLIHDRDPDRSELWGIYNRLTVNRQSGIHARLANTILNSTSLVEMKQLAELEPEKILNEADRIRYNNIHKDLRYVVDKLLCLILPFRENEVINIFIKDRVQEAIHEAVRHGLLRKLDNNRYEFHETIRKGLLNNIPLAEYTSINKFLAEYYLQTDDIITSIFHLEESGDIKAAHEKARSEFLKGHYRSRLHAYITKHQLLNSSEIIVLLNQESETEKYYMLPDMLKHIGDKTTALELLKIINDNSERFDNDFRWAWKTVEAIIICDPTCLYELVLFGLKQTKHEKGHDRLEWVIQGIRSPTTPLIDDRLLNLFSNQTIEIKRKLIPLLLLDKRRKILTPAFSFLDSLNKSPLHSEVNEQKFNKYINLKFDTTDEICEFLVSLPIPQSISEMLKHKSVLLGIFEKYIWSERNKLQPQCIEILNNSNLEAKIHLNALRVLTFLQDEFAVSFAEQYSGNEDNLKVFSAFLPVFYKNTINPEKYRAKVLDANLSMEKRVTAFYILSHTSENIDPIIEILTSNGSTNIDAWKYIIVMNSINRPWKSAIPLFEEMLKEPEINSKLSVLAPIILKFGELPGKDATYFLIRMLKTPWIETKYFSCISLQNRRSKHALTELIYLCYNEKDPELRHIAFVAAIASGPESHDIFTDIFDNISTTIIWRCILAARLRSTSEAKWLIKTATDQKEHWQVRRAAILAISFLPYNIALKKIYKSILKEKSSFYIDDSPSLTLHSILASLIISEGQAFLRFYLEGKESFVKLWGDIFFTLSKDTFYPISEERGDIYAEWLYTRLELHGWPKEKSALDVVYNEIHIPILHAAIIRGLRLTGKRDIIEEIVIKSDTEWLLSRCLCEWFKMNEQRPEDINRIKYIFSKSKYSKSISANNIIKNCSEKKGRINNSNSKTIENIKQLFCLNYDDTIKILETDQNHSTTQYKLINLTKSQFIKLIKELDPNNDYETKETYTEPKLEFSHSGPSIRQINQVSTNKKQPLREALRAALVVANTFDIDIPWHSNLISGIQGSNRYEHLSDKYSTEYLKNIAEQRDSESLYKVLEQSGDLIIERLGKISYMENVKSLINEKIIPYLRIYANVGTDVMLESLCSLALCINEDKIDPVLSELFTRWYNRFDRTDNEIQHYRNTPLWRAFNCLRKHPRFNNIPDYDLRLLEILNCNIYWIYRDDIITTLRDSPRCYIKIEEMLMKATPFEHRLWDEVDNLDKIADNLFKQTID